MRFPNTISTLTYALSLFNTDLKKNYTDISCNSRVSSYCKKVDGTNICPLSKETNISLYSSTSIPIVQGANDYFQTKVFNPLMFFSKVTICLFSYDYFLFCSREKPSSENIILEIDGKEYPTKLNTKYIEQDSKIEAKINLKNSSNILLKKKFDVCYPDFPVIMKESKQCFEKKNVINVYSGSAIKDLVISKGPKMKQQYDLIEMKILIQSYKRPFISTLILILTFFLIKRICLLPQMAGLSWMNLTNTLKSACDTRFETKSFIENLNVKNKDSFFELKDDVINQNYNLCKSIDRGQKIFVHENNSKILKPVLANKTKHIDNQRVNVCSHQGVNENKQELLETIQEDKKTNIVTQDSKILTTSVNLIIDKLNENLESSNNQPEKMRWYNYQKLIHSNTRGNRQDNDVDRISVGIKAATFEPFDALVKMRPNTFEQNIKTKNLRKRKSSIEDSYDNNSDSSSGGGDSENSDISDEGIILITTEEEFKKDQKVNNDFLSLPASNKLTAKEKDNLQKKFMQTYNEKVLEGQRRRQTLKQVQDKKDDIVLIIQNSKTNREFESFSKKRKNSILTLPDIPLSPKEFKKLKKASKNSVDKRLAKFNFENSIPISDEVTHKPNYIFKNQSNFTCESHSKIHRKKLQKVPNRSKYKAYWQLASDSFLPRQILNSEQYFEENKDLQLWYQWQHIRQNNELQLDFSKKVDYKEKQLMIHMKEDIKDKKQKQLSTMINSPQFQFETSNIEKMKTILKKYQN